VPVPGEVLSELAARQGLLLGTKHQKGRVHPRSTPTKHQQPPVCLVLSYTRLVLGERSPLGSWLAAPLPPRRPALSKLGPAVRCRSSPEFPFRFIWVLGWSTWYLCANDPTPCTCNTNFAPRGRLGREGTVRGTVSPAPLRVIERSWCQWSEKEAQIGSIAPCTPTGQRGGKGQYDADCVSWVG
jgi:hypothetical protein